MTLRGLLRLTTLALLLVLAAGGGFAFLLRSRWKGYASPSVLVEIPPGSSTSSILFALERGGVLRSRHAGLLALRLFRRGRTLKAGEYRLSGARTPLEALDPILDGDVVSYAVTVPEGFTAAEAFDLFAAGGFGSRAELARLFDSPAAFPSVPPGAPSLEGFLFPDTYRVTRSMKARDVVAALTRQFAHRLPRDFAARARSRGLSVLEAVTLASIVEKETAVPSERGVVSAVYLNRLRVGMPLQADPTVVYALKRRGQPGVPLLRADLAVDDPYNTYVHGGLPPGPICSPGLPSLEAAVSPDPVPYLYFVARGDGSHRFAVSYDDQLHNVALYRRARQAAPGGAR